MIVCENVSKVFDAGVEFCAVNKVSLHIKKGEFAALVGKSGSGKSTLMNMIGLIDVATSGKIKIDDISVEAMNSSERALIRNKKIGYIFQSFYLEPSYSVYKNVEMPLLIANVPASKRKQRIEECLRRVDMLDKINSDTGTLSGGEKQRICIARALANNPEIILADEPCGNLDSENTKNIMNILKELNKNNTTILMVTHSNEDAQNADRIITLKDGKIVSDED